VCVHPNYGALPETSGCLNVMYQGNMENYNEHANVFASHLNAAIKSVIDKSHHNMVSFNKVFVDSRYNMSRIKNQWEVMLENLLIQYPNASSRKKPQEMFVYNT